MNDKQFESNIDSYFGNLINASSKKGLSTQIFIPHIKLNKKQFIKYLEKTGYDSYLLDKYCKLQAKFKTIIAFLKERQKFLKLSRNMTGYISNLFLYTAESFLFTNNFCNIIYGLQIEEIIKNTK